MAAADPCPFCAVRGEAVLWEDDRYRILADAFPRCTGHLLLITRRHLASHMDAPGEWLPALLAAQERAARFLQEQLGGASFFENGGARQAVPHAHLHGLPLAVTVQPAWLREGRLERVSGWPGVRQERERRGFYFYLESAPEAYLLRDYSFVRREIRKQALLRTDARAGRGTKLLRGGPDMVARTVRLWRESEERMRNEGGFPGDVREAEGHR